MSEFGARWHFVSWGMNSLLGDDSLPFLPRLGQGRISYDMPLSDAGEWTWKAPMPSGWNPQVHQSGTGISVTFYTLGALWRQEIIRHIDRYVPGRYRLKMGIKVIAEGPAGWVV